MTEDEAKTKWCPFVRQADSSASFNRGAWGSPGSSDYDPVNSNHADGVYACNCIGSACMAWRLDRGWSRDDRTGLDGPSSPRGYCGLAGKP